MTHPAPPTGEAQADPKDNYMPIALVSLLPMIGCAAMMVLCARMMRGHGSPPSTADADQVPLLRAEIAELRARLDEPARPDVSPHVR